MEGVLIARESVGGGSSKAELDAPDLTCILRSSSPCELSPDHKVLGNEVKSNFPARAGNPSGRCSSCYRGFKPL